MSKQKETKTNAMRILDRMKIPYKTYSYECDSFIDAQQTAALLGIPHEKMFKTLVTVSPANGYFVFAIPIDRELDLKKAAHEAAQKSLSMIHVKDLLSVTGYVRGGCTAVGMKKQFPTVIDESARDLDEFYVSGGRVGTQLRLAPEGLKRAASATYADVIR